jgi:hypothetical protein
MTTFDDFPNELIHELFSWLSELAQLQLGSTDHRSRAMRLAIKGLGGPPKLNSFRVITECVADGNHTVLARFMKQCRNAARKGGYGKKIITLRHNWILHEAVRFGQKWVVDQFRQIRWCPSPPVIMYVSKVAINREIMDYLIGSFKLNLGEIVAGPSGRAERFIRLGYSCKELGLDGKVSSLVVRAARMSSKSPNAVGLDVFNNPQWGEHSFETITIHRKHTREVMLWAIGLMKPKQGMMTSEWRAVIDRGDPELLKLTLEKASPLVEQKSAIISTAIWRGEVAVLNWYISTGWVVEITAIPHGSRQMHEWLIKYAADEFAKFLKGRGNVARYCLEVAKHRDLDLFRQYFPLIHENERLPVIRGVILYDNPEVLEFLLYAVPMNEIEAKKLFQSAICVGKYSNAMLIKLFYSPTFDISWPEEKLMTSARLGEYYGGREAHNPDICNDHLQILRYYKEKK